MHKTTSPACVLLLALLAGCSTTPHYDQHYGDAVRQARAAMTLKPADRANADASAGMDGQTANLALERYRDSFKTQVPPPAPQNVINIGL